VRRFGNLLIALGIVLILIPVAGYLFTLREQAQLMSQYEDSLQETFAETDLPESLPLPAEEDPALAEPQPQADDQPAAEAQEEPQQAAAPQVEPVKPKPKLPVIGQIKIAAIRLDLPILRGVSRQNMRYGIGYMEGSGSIGKVGNAVLAGHRNYPFGQMFNRLDEVAIGDEVVIKANKQTYRYRVYKKLVVLPSDVSVIKKLGDEKTLTLVTCTPKGKDTHRLIIHARLE